MYTHFINDSSLKHSQKFMRTENKPKRLKLFPWAGRYILRLDKNGNHRRFGFNFEWCFEWGRNPCYEFHVGPNGDEPITFLFTIPFIAFFSLAFEGPLARWIQNKMIPLKSTGEIGENGKPVMNYRNYKNRVTGFSIHDWTLFWKCWAPEHEWSRNNPWWRSSGSFGFKNLSNFFLGKEKIEKEVMTTKEVTIPMPEGNYSATAEVIRRIYKRPRWFSRIHYSVKIDEIKGSNNKKTSIPHPGKGTTSYNCEPSGIQSMSVPGLDIEKAIGTLIASSLKNRRRYPL